MIHNKFFEMHLDYLLALSSLLMLLVPTTTTRTGVNHSSSYYGPTQEDKNKIDVIAWTEADEKELEENMVSFSLQGLGFLVNHVASVNLDQAALVKNNQVTLRVEEVEKTANQDLRSLDKMAAEQGWSVNFTSLRLNIREKINWLEENVPGSIRLPQTDDDTFLNKDREIIVADGNRAKKELLSHLEELLSGLIGESVRMANNTLLNNLYNKPQCQSPAQRRQFQNVTEVIAELVHSGVFSFLAFEKHIDNGVDLNSLLRSISQLNETYVKVAATVNNFLWQCRQEVDINQVIRNVTMDACRSLDDHQRKRPCTSDDIQESVLDELRKYYDDFGNWIVLVFNDTVDYRLPPTFYVVHVAKYSVIVAAYAAEKRQPSMPDRVVRRLELFYPPYETSKDEMKPYVKKDANFISSALKDYLVGVAAVRGTHLEVAAFVLDEETEKCAVKQVESRKRLTSNTAVCEIIKPAKACRNRKDNPINKQLGLANYWLASGYDCGYYYSKENNVKPRRFDVIVFPVSAESATLRLSNSPEDSNCKNDTNEEGYHPLRQEIEREMYLSVEGDAATEGALVVLEHKWTKSKGQLWRFTNNGQLMNAHGLCLTATNQQLLRQQKCSQHSSDDQRWRRSGLQIVNDVNTNADSRAYCLSNYVSFVRGRFQFQRHVTRMRCVPWMTWRFWHKCDELADEPFYKELADRASMCGQCGKPLRNELTNNYLTYHNNELSMGRWKNPQLRQWHFRGHYLMNDYSANGDGNKCLTFYTNNGTVAMTQRGKSARVQQQQINYNTMTRFISNSEGYCFGVETYSKFLIHPCSSKQVWDNIKAYKWIF